MERFINKYKVIIFMAVIEVSKGENKVSTDVLRASIHDGLVVGALGTENRGGIAHFSLAGFSPESLDDFLKELKNGSAISHLCIVGWSNNKLLKEDLVDGLSRYLVEKCRINPDRYLRRHYNPMLLVIPKDVRFEYY